MVVVCADGVCLPAVDGYLSRHVSRRSISTNV